MVVLLASGGYDGTIRMWDAASGSCYRVLQHPEKQVNALLTSPDKQYLVAGGNPLIKLYEVDGKNPEPLLTFEGHTGPVTCLGFQRDGRWMFSGSEDGTVKIWDLRAPGFQRDYECRGGVNSVALHPNQGELLSGDAAGCVRVWDLTASACSLELSPEGNTPLSAVSVAADASLLVAANFNGNVFAWGARGGSTDVSPLARFAAHKSYITSARLSPDGQWLATAGSDRTVKLWSLPKFTLSSTLSGHSRWVWDAVFSADSNYLVTASSDMTAKLWDVGTSACVRVFTGHTKAVTAVTLNDAAPVAAAGGGAGGEAGSAPPPAASPKG